MESVKKKRRTTKTAAAMVEAKSDSNAAKLQNVSNGMAPKKKKRRTTTASDAKPKSESDSNETKPQNFLYGYDTLFCIFQYLEVHDLLRTKCVCTMWRDVASHRLLWRTVCMNNSRIHSFAGLLNALEIHGTVHLDLRQMCWSHNATNDIWQEFSEKISSIDSLKRIELGLCPAFVVEHLALCNSKLEVINAVSLKCQSMSLAPLIFLKDLKELQLKSTSYLFLTSNLDSLSGLLKLKHLSLTSINDLNKLNIEVIANLRNLISLDLGECRDLPATFGSNILPRLTKLVKLRIEGWTGKCYTFEFFQTVKNMPQLEQLELVNFDIRLGFDRALGACKNIKKLMIIPTYISQSATTNHMVLGGVLRLQNKLTQFVWGLTLEMLKVTELFVETHEKIGNLHQPKPIGYYGDRIPVLKPIPILKDGIVFPIEQDPSEFEILTISNLRKLLNESLITAHIEILKIPSYAACRQRLDVVF